MKASPRGWKATQRRLYRIKGFTRTELFVVSIIVLGLSVWYLTILAKSKRDQDREICKSNLKALDQAYQNWLLDHDQYPWLVLPKDGGSNGKAKASEHYQAISDCVINPKLLLCPTAKRSRSLARDMRDLKDSNLSYSIGVDSRPFKESFSWGHSGNVNFIAADFNITDEGQPPPVGICGRAGGIKADQFNGKYGKEDTYKAIWGPGGHPIYGTVLLESGVVVDVDTNGLRRILSCSQDVGDESHILKPGP